MPSVSELRDKAVRVLEKLPNYKGGWASVSDAHTEWFKKVHRISEERWPDPRNRPPDIDEATNIGQDEFDRLFAEFESFPLP